MVETPQQERWIDTIVFWLLGGALFFTIALLPNILLAVFYGPVAVHIIVVTACSFILLLLWVASVFRPTDRPSPSPRRG